MYSNRTIVKWLWHAWKGNRLQAFINMSIGLLDVGVSLAQVWAVKRAIDIASHSMEGDVIPAVCIMGALILCGFGLGMAEVWVRNILGVRAQNRMQRQMLDHILHSVWRGREEMHSGDVINRLERDVNNVVSFLTETLPNTVSVIALFVGAFFYLFSMDRVLAVIIVGILPVFILLSRVYVNRMRGYSREVRNSDSKVQSLLQETIQHRVLVKTLEQESAMLEKLDGQHSALQKNVVRRTRFSLFSRFVLNFGFALSYLIAFAWSALRLAAGTLSYGGMTAFLQLVNKIQSPARDLTKLAPAFVQVLTAAERLMVIEKSSLEETGEPVELQAPCGIRLENVSYFYDDNSTESASQTLKNDTIHGSSAATESEKMVLNELSFDFKPGTCTAILGETGSGKTTIFRLIQDLVKPSRGCVRIYNKEKNFLVSPLTRCNMEYVPQGNTLLSGTIRDNLLLGSELATEEDMRKALSIACADFVFSLPEGLDTNCSEFGVGLSEGQAQRICIARALLRNRPILLLDEATSALDPETERLLLKNLLTSKRYTVLFITHRPAVVEYCDAVLDFSKM